jgi:hypothetical protein
MIGEIATIKIVIVFGIVNSSVTYELRKEIQGILFETPQVRLLARLVSIN